MYGRDGYINHPIVTIEEEAAVDVPLQPGMLRHFLALLPNQRATLTAGEYYYTIATMDGVERCSVRIEHDLTYLGHLESGAISETNFPVIPDILHPDNAKRYFSPGYHEISLLNNKGVMEHYCFSTDCALSIVKDRYGELSCRVYDTHESCKIGEGAFAEVYDVLGAAKPRVHRNPELQFEDDENIRIVKIFRANHTPAAEFKRSVKQAYRNAKQTPHLYPRKPSFGLSADGKQVACYELRKKPGRPLTEYFQTDAAALEYQDFTCFTLEDRFEICIQLFKKLIEQVHAVGLVHRDLQSANILLSSTGHGWVVNIVDVDLAKQIGDTDISAIGIAAFLDRYAVNSKNLEASDVFAMALNAGMIWRDSRQHHIMTLNQPVKICEERIKSSWKVSFDLFAGLDDLPAHLRTAISTLLEACTTDDLTARLSATDALLTFEKLYQQYKKEQRALPEAEQANVDTAFTSALEARRVLAEFNNCPLSRDNVNKCEEQLTAIFTVLPDDELAISEFVKTLDVTLLCAATDKQTLIDGVHTVAKRFFDLHSALNKQHEEICEIKLQLGEAHSIANKIEHYRMGLHKFCLKLLKLPVNLDRMADECAHMEIKIAKVNATIKYFKSWIIDEPCVSNNKMFYL